MRDVLCEAYSRIGDSDAVYACNKREADALSRFVSKTSIFTSLKRSSCSFRPCRVKLYEQAGEWAAAAQMYDVMTSDSQLQQSSMSNALYKLGSNNLLEVYLVIFYK